MFDLLTESPSGLRFVITMGAGRFRDLPAEAALGRVDDDMRSIARLFASYGFEHVLQACSLTLPRVSAGELVFSGT